MNRVEREIKGSFWRESRSDIVPSSVHTYSSVSISLGGVLVLLVMVE